MGSIPIRSTNFANALNKKQLLDAIAHLPDDAEIVMEYGFYDETVTRPMVGICTEKVFVPKTSFSGGTYDPMLDAEEYALSEDEWAKVVNGKKAIILIAKS